MSRHKGNRFFAIALSLLVGATLVGCGSGTPKIEKAEQSGIYLTEEGNVTVFLVETFDKEYYDAAELEQMILAEIDAYNATTDVTADEAAAQKAMAPVQLVDILSPEEKNTSISGASADTITVQMEYATSADYTAFNGKVLFFGTVAQAEVSGYPIKTDLKSVAGDEVLKKADASAMSENHILVFEESVTVHVPFEVLYVSDGVTVDGKTVVFEEAEGKVATVIMK